MQLTRRTLFKGLLGSAAGAALAETAIGAAAAAPATVTAVSGGVTPLAGNILRSSDVSLEVQGTVVARPAAAENDLLDQRFRTQFDSPYHAVTIAPANLDALFVALLKEHAAEFPLLTNLTRDISTNEVLTMTMRKTRNPNFTFDGLDNRLFLFERTVHFMKHMDYKTGRMQQEMLLFDDGVTTAATARRNADAVQAGADVEGALGVMRRIEWALLHADGNEDFEGMVGVNPATIYRGLLAQATQVYDGNITRQEQARLAHDITMLNEYLAIPIRENGKIGTMQSVIALAPPWYVKRNGSGVMTNFGALKVLPSPYLHTDLVAFNNDVADVKIAQGGPLTRMPLAVVSTRVESLYFLRHTLAVTNAERILRVPVLPPADVPTPDLAPPPFTAPPFDRAIGRIY